MIRGFVSTAFGTENPTTEYTLKQRQPFGCLCFLYELYNKHNSHLDTSAKKTLLISLALIEPVSLQRSGKI